MKKRYWHTLSNATIKKLLAKGISYAELVERYKQPDWCSYPDALAGVMGCWSLNDEFNLRRQISIDYCSECDCFIKQSV